MKDPIQTLIGPVESGHNIEFTVDGTKQIRPWFRLGDRRYTFDDHNEPLALLLYLYQQMSIDQIKVGAR